MKIKKTQKGFTVGVESFLPSSEDWWATIYTRWMGKYFTSKQLIDALRESGAEFTLCYDSLSPEKKDACRRITDIFHKNKIGFLFNNTYGDIFGPWQKNRGRAEYSKKDITYALQSPYFMGIVRDELEHRQIHHADCGAGPYLADVRGLTSRQAYQAVYKAVRKMLLPYESQNIPQIGEYVFPSLFHLFARAGIIPAPKVLKESYNTIMLAMGMGAAKEYRLPFWAVADLWGPDRFWKTFFDRAPGHGPNEYLSALIISYWLGTTHLYTEGLHNLIYPIHTTQEEWKDLMQHPLSHRGKKDPMTFWAREKGYILNVYGKYHRWFVKEYIPKNPRGYNCMDVEPKVAIIRFPDSCYCKSSYHPQLNHLFAPDGPVKKPVNEAWIDLWTILTHGAVRDTLFYIPEKNRQNDTRPVNEQIDYPFTDYHTAFCPLDGVVVYDHLVDERLLRTIPLLACTGEILSGKTRIGIDKCVRNGANCLILENLAVPWLTKKSAGKPVLITHGKGKFLITPHFRNREVRNFIKPFMGKPDEIRYRFAGRDIVLKPLNGNFNCIVKSKD